MAARRCAKGVPGRSGVGLICHLGVKSEDVTKLEVVICDEKKKKSLFV